MPSIKEEDASDSVFEERFQFWSGIVNAWSDGLLGVDNEEQSMHQEDNVTFMVVNLMGSSYEMLFEVFMGLADRNKVWYDMACANLGEDSYHAWDSSGQWPFCKKRDAFLFDRGGLLEHVVGSMRMDKFPYDPKGILESSFQFYITV
ncbi:hypothetical protein L7F22_063862 [Adiantum nelumboides]|nr:hypothetical protein [Adiantum nelumboides]